MKYLITGGCGFLGSNLASECLKRGDELTIFDNLSRFGSDKNLAWLKSNGEFKFIYGDIRNQNDVDRLVIEEKPDIIFHLAGQVAMTTSIKNPRLDFEINVVGTFNLLDAVRKYSPNSGIIYSSTNKVYGDLEWLDYEEKDKRYELKRYPLGLPESIPLSFSSPYGCSKGAADQYMVDFNRIFGLKTLVFRHSSMYGGRQFATADQGWVGWFCEQAIKNLRCNGMSSFTISGNGKQVRDVLNADDMITLYFLAAEKINSLGGEVFNVGGGVDNSFSLLELFELLEQELNIKLNYEKLSPRSSDQKVFIADITKANQLIGWQPKVNSLVGIKRMLEWVDKSI